MTTLVSVLICLLVIFSIYILLITPDLTGKQKATFLLGKNIAHRGLHNNNQGVPENSLEAAKKSVLCGFGIEFDIQLSKDKQVMVFHDDTLERVTGHNGNVCDYTKSELQQMSLLGTNQTIPTLNQYLDIVKGKVPLIIELKGGKQNPLLCQKAAEILDKYDGDFVIESFFPDIVSWFKKNRPNYIRGQLSLHMKDGKENFWVRFILAYLLTNFIAKPHFVAYRHNDVHNLSFKLCKLLGVMTVGWTLDDLESYKKATTIFDTIIFENILPANDYVPSKSNNIHNMPKVTGDASVRTKTQNTKTND